MLTFPIHGSDTRKFTSCRGHPYYLSNLLKIRYIWKGLKISVHLIFVFGCTDIFVTFHTECKKHSWHGYHAAKPCPVRISAIRRFWIVSVARRIVWGCTDILMGVYRYISVRVPIFCYMLVDTNLWVYRYLARLKNIGTPTFLGNIGTLARQARMVYRYFNERDH